MNRVTITLILCTVFPAIGWIVNTVWPAPVYGYKMELALLVVLGVVALWVARANQARVIFAYFSLALVPVGMMLEHYGKGGSALVLTPLLGVALVAILTHCERIVVSYGVVALCACCVTGITTGDLGLGGALAFLSGGLTAGALWWVRDCSVKVQLQDIQSQQKAVERGLSRITKELG